MEKLVYLLKKPAAQTAADFSQLLRGEVLDQLRAAGARQLTINIADLNEEIQQQSPGRLIGPWQEVGAAVELWHDCIDQRAPIETALSACSDRIDGYLVTESIPQACDRSWADGERRPGVTQFGCNGKPANVTDEEFYHNWQVVHSTQSFELHPLRWSYVRNAVARRLTDGAPDYRAIVSEHFKTLEDFVDDSRYFGSMEAIQEMIEHVPGFCDADNMFSVPMSEYHFA